MPAGLTAIAPSPQGPAPPSRSPCSAPATLPPAGKPIDVEACFSQLTLDVIGKAVFNYDFDSLNKNTPVIQASPHGRFC